MFKVQWAWYNQAMDTIKNSQALFNQAQQFIPGGVNSPVRAFGSVGGTPRFIQSAKGAHITDVDGNQYIDYVGSWGPMVLGHADADVMQAVMDTAQRGLSFGAPCELEVKLAAEICRLIPSMDKVRMVNSGTEATMSALRLARGFTGKDKIIKFQGCYHGHADFLLVKAGSGTLTFGNPTSPGVPAATVKDTLVAEYNDLDSVLSLLEANKGEVAAIIVEPIAGNMNMVLPTAGFLQGLRDLCDQHEALLIFDEVMTGFRVGLTGVQGLYDIKPDLTTFGKIIGGGMPVGAFGGSAEIMGQLSPEGPVYQAGTLSGNPVAMAAGLKTLEKIQAPGFYQQLEQKTQQLVAGLLDAAKKNGIALSANQAAGMFGLFFSEEENISTYQQVMACNGEHFKAFFHGMLERGVYLAPSMFEAGFISIAHDDHILYNTRQAADQVFSILT